MFKPAEIVAVAACSEPAPIVIDAFCFFNELDLFYLRILETNELVDYYVIVESFLTHTGSLKDLVWESKGKYDKRFDKYRYVCVLQ